MSPPSAADSTHGRSCRTDERRTCCPPKMSAPKVRARCRGANPSKRAASFQLRGELWQTRLCSTATPDFFKAVLAPRRFLQMSAKTNICPLLRLWATYERSFQCHLGHFFGAFFVEICAGCFLRYLAILVRLSADVRLDSTTGSSEINQDGIEWERFSASRRRNYSSYGRVPHPFVP